MVGEAHFVAEREQAGRRYLRYLPEAQTYLEMQNFSFYRIVPISIRYIGGFDVRADGRLLRFGFPELVLDAQQALVALSRLVNF